MPPIVAQGAPNRNQVDVNLGARSYSILIGSSLLGAAACFEPLSAGGMAMVVTNGLVDSMYGDRLRSTLSGRFANVETILLPDGESHKTWASVNLIHEALLRRAFDRSSIVFALGGGVVGDMAGFAAASYMRGISYVQVPTTLLSQVDSSVGGKTGINHPLGKNMIGAFHQPSLVLCDIDTLASLPPRELCAGLAEVIKYGPIADLEFFDWVERHIGDLRRGDSDALAYAVQRSCEIKAEVVAGDEREAGRRAILNFGHTFGHAIEAGLGYGEWLHGEAVGCGMIMAARLSERLGLVDAQFVERLQKLVSAAGLPTVGPNLGTDRYLELMRVDKKAKGGEIRFVLIDGAGRAMLRTAPAHLVGDVLRESCA